MSKTFTPAEVAQHKDEKNGIYIIVDDGVYDITNFIDEHPGGPKILKRMAGKDSTKAFWKYHSKHVLDKYAEKLKVGTVGDKAKL
ncbi:hypothetical protein MCOR27_010514 [Pyricularia oryzae]|uniref:Cytochrome b5 heme-binding domain-containing protein n=4 Tax=Pyricularia TaxID=48558 RepID=A0ABQ8N3Z3_PYRGI|nr:hypothetical protein OOU_Y34scaffold00051g7 [Pyricularia oryzae Y34]KAH8847561.1 hypothetical protein MCOR01_000979 [Pyricularia oryzae]KAI6290874.1 hypothetical protein MCOR33_010996 [Pyricularia grisea]KAH9427206.1 hypothetical protein MCOR02_012331 [Pyricularia oryzae]KAI6252813.1 hypothetical protein MCOR19_010598 [Pyricularia oryzae]